VVLVPGLGMFTAGRDARTAGIVDDIYHHTVDVIGNASSFGRYVSLSANDAFDVEYWPLELYQLTLAPPEQELARRIVRVTGLRRVLGGQGGRGAARQGTGPGGRAARDPLEHHQPRRRLPGLQALVGGDPPRARGRAGHRRGPDRGLLSQAQPARRPHPPRRR